MFFSSKYDFESQEHMGYEAAVPQRVYSQQHCLECLVVTLRAKLPCSTVGQVHASASEVLPWIYHLLNLSSTACLIEPLKHPLGVL